MAHLRFGGAGLILAAKAWPAFDFPDFADLFSGNRETPARGSREQREAWAWAMGIGRQSRQRSRGKECTMPEKRGNAIQQ